MNVLITWCQKLINVGKSRAGKDFRYPNPGSQRSQWSSKGDPDVHGTAEHFGANLRTARVHSAQVGRTWDPLYLVGLLGVSTPPGGKGHKKEKYATHASVF